MTPEELEKLPKPLERTMTALELSIMEEVIQRIKEVGQITPVIDWMLNRLAAIGESKSRIKQLIGEAVKEADLQIDEIYKQAVLSDYIRKPWALSISHTKAINGYSKLWMLLAGRLKAVCGHWKTLHRLRGLM